MRRGGGGGGSLNAVFYAKTYHPIQAGSIDGTDILPHDNAVYRASLCSNAGLYDPFGDLKATGDPYCTLFVARLSPLTTEVTLRKAMDQYGRVKNLRLVRHIVTGASRGYAFVEFETEKEMRRAYNDAHHTRIDDSEIIVDYNRQQLMPGWIPRRLGGGLGGKKESGQLRFGGRERPFRAPLKEVPFGDLKRLGIPPPPERYMSRFEVPSPPRRKSVSAEVDEHQEVKRDRSPVRRSKHDQDPGDGSRGRRYADEGRQKKHDWEWHRHEERRHSSSEKRRRRHDRYRDEDEEEEGHRRQQHYADSGRDDRWVPGGDDLY